MVATFDSTSVVATEQAEARLSLVNGFDLRLETDRLEMPLHAQRLLAFLALRPHPMVRGHVAGRLWPDTDEGKASANLRSVVWRIERHGHGLLDSTRTHIRISPRVKVDVIEAVEIARRLDEDVEDAMLLDGEVRRVFSTGELLPDWYDEQDWLAAERARFHQIRLHALERISRLLLTRGRHHEAIDAALAAVAADPLRESAHRSVIAAHLAEGNHVDAIRQYDTFRRHLAEEMGSSPSPQMEALMSPAW